jgi:hypothetical protein
MNRGVTSPTETWPMIGEFNASPSHGDFGK